MGANAQTAVPSFTAGQVLTAVQQTQINTGIPVFATSVTRDAAFGGTGEKTLAEGQFAYLEDSNTTQYYDGSAWQALTGARIGQVVSTTKTDTFTAATTTYTDITGLSVSITPTSATSKVFVLAMITGSNDVTVSVATLRLMRNTTAIAIGDTAGNRIVGTAPLTGGQDAAQNNTQMIAFLDSPATTSATTYKIQGRSNASADTFFINRSDTDSDSTVFNRTVSTIAVFEVIV
jgi:hypothetical protein